MEETKDVRCSGSSGTAANAQCNGEDLAQVLVEENFQAYARRQFHEFRHASQNRNLMPWDALSETFAPSPEALASLLVEVRSAFPFLKEQRVNYMGFQSSIPSRGKGSGHVLFLNAFDAGSFPTGLYWEDLGGTSRCAYT